MKKIKRNLNNLSIKWKIFYYLFGFCAILLIILWLFQTTFLESFYKSIKLNQIKSNATTISKNIDNDNLVDLIKDISMSSDSCIVIVDKNSEATYEYSSYRNCMLNDISLIQIEYLISKANDNGGELIGYYDKNELKFGNIIDPNYPFNNDGNYVVSIETPQTLIYVKNILKDNGEQITLFISSFTTPVNATISTLRIQLIYITIIMVVLSALLAFIISKKVSKPIESINSSAKVLSKGNYDVKFDSKGYKEINELSETLSYTATELSKVESLRRELIANISHDLRTPLTLIAGYAEAMRDLPNENNFENAQIILEEANRLSALVSDALDISKLQSGVVELDIEEFNLTKLLDSSIKRISELVKSGGYSILFEYDNEVYVNADESKISQVFYNLLINAINYSHDDKEIIVKQKDLTDEVKIDVIDKGEGIDKEDLSKIWDRYYKVDKNHKRSFSGSGIGLSIVKSIMILHKTKYGVDSEKGQGSDFWFYLKKSK
ncbi:MAG: HAMP domain-containing sensor histidine kinase [Bacilli bacterium]|nr:HAMP domain-containing sensor histidine kinase [Bacilli bacterium]